MITEKDVEDALEKLGNPELLALALGEKIKAEHMLKVTKALEMKKTEGSVAAQEREACASVEYRMAIQVVVNSTITYEKEKAYVEANKMTIDLYRTQQANQRYNI